LFLVPYLEPGRNRRQRRPSVTQMLWLFACALALTLAVQAILR
jgi:hypothetical protein